MIYLFLKVSVLGSIPAPLKKRFFSTANDDCSVINPFRSGDNSVTYINSSGQTYGSATTENSMARNLFVYILDE